MISLGILCFLLMLRLLVFIENLPRVMKIADIMVTRAGASTISEIMAIDTVSIFIPSPYVTNNHQEMNAMDLVNKKAGRMIREADLIRRLCLVKLIVFLIIGRNMKRLKGI